MNMENISVPEVYDSSSDFRIFKHWFQYCLSKLQYDTENLPNLYDPLKCPTQLLWMLADTMGFRYDNRLCEAFNRFVLLYFMAMIRNRGSQNGITLAAETNLKQFDISVMANDGYTINRGMPDEQFIEPNEIYYHRLDSTDLPVNSAYVTPHTDEGYIDIVYFSEQLPIDACIEYVRPIGMYCFQSYGVRMDARSKVYVDTALQTMMNDKISDVGRNRVADYSRKDYASLQKMEEDQSKPFKQYKGVPSETRDLAYKSNSLYEGTPTVDAGFRAMYSLQLCNNEHIMQALLPNSSEQLQQYIFGLGYDLSTGTVDDDYRMQPEAFDNGTKNWNLFYDKTVDERYTYKYETGPFGSSTTETDTKSPRTVPQVNPIMAQIGDAIIKSETATTIDYLHINSTGEVETETADKYNPQE